MAVKTKTLRSYVSDISGRDLNEREHVRIQAKAGDGRTWILDASISEVDELLSDARETTGMGRSFNGNGNSNN